MKIRRQNRLDRPDQLASCTGTLMVLGGIITILTFLATAVWLGWSWVAERH